MLQMVLLTRNRGCPLQLLFKKRFESIKKHSDYFWGQNSLFDVASTILQPLSTSRYTSSRRVPGARLTLAKLTQFEFSTKQLLQNIRDIRPYYGPRRPYSRVVAKRFLTTVPSTKSRPRQDDIRRWCTALDH